MRRVFKSVTVWVLVIGFAVSLLGERAWSENETETSGEKPLAADVIRFEKTECGTIVDPQTGFEWLLGPDRPVTWADARSMVERLDWCGGRWRVPSWAEMATLFVNEKTPQGTIKKIDPEFRHMGKGSHWSFWWVKKRCNALQRAFSGYDGWPVAIGKKTGACDPETTAGLRRVIAVRNTRPENRTR